MPFVGTDPADELAQVDPVELAVRLVVLEPHERERTDVDGRPGAVGKPDREGGGRTISGSSSSGITFRPSPGRVERRRLELVAVAVALDRHVPRERVAAVGPPEPRAPVVVERQHLARERLAGERLDGQVAVEDVVDLGAILEEEPVTDRLVADAVADDQVVGPVDRDPAVAAVPERRPDDGAAAHRVAGQVEVEAVLAEDPLLAQVAELGVADRAGRAAVVHRVAASLGGVGRLDDDVSAQVGDLAAVVSLAQVVLLQGAVQGDAWFRRSRVMVRSSVNAFIESFPWPARSVARSRLSRWVAVTITRSPTRQPGTASASVTTASPARAVVPSFTQVRPSGAPWRSIRPPQQTIAGQVSGSMPAMSHQPDHGGVTGRDRMSRRADLQRRPGTARVGLGRMRVAVEAVLAGVITGLDLDQTDVEPGVAVRVEAERAGHMDRADRLVGGHVVGDRVARAYLDPRPRTGNAPPFPGLRLGPGPAPCRADERLGGRGASWFHFVAPRPRGERQQHRSDRSGSSRYASWSNLSLDLTVDRGRAYAAAVTNPPAPTRSGAAANPGCSRRNGAPPSGRGRPRRA